MNQFEESFLHVVGVEGRYSNNPNDLGGETMFGITVAVARANGYEGRMQDMPLDWAKRIYKAQYWDLLKLDQIAVLAPTVAHELFDSAVNCGIAKAATWLQQALNALNKRGSFYADMAVDGVVGNVTVAAFKSYINTRGASGVTVMLRVLNGLQCARYVEITQAREANEDFFYGWVLNRVA